MSGLIKRMDANHETYLEDAFKTIINALQAKFQRLECKIPAHDKSMSMLLKRIGFLKEGILRKYAKIDGKCFDTAVYSIVKE